jgi:hypothetical protein
MIDRVADNNTKENPDAISVIKKFINDEHQISQEQYK